MRELTHSPKPQGRPAQRLHTPLPLLTSPSKKTHTTSPAPVPTHPYLFAIVKVRQYIVHRQAAVTRVIRVAAHRLLSSSPPPRQKPKWARASEGEEERETARERPGSLFSLCLGSAIFNDPHAPKSYQYPGKKVSNSTLMKKNSPQESP